MGHQVRDAGVLVVADACDDGQRELGDVGAEAVGVEAGEVVARPSAADQHRGVELLLPPGDGAERGDDRLLGGGALHEGVEEREREAVGASGDFAAELALDTIAMRCAGTGSGSSRFISHTPSSRRRAMVCWRWRSMSPSVKAGSMSVIWSEKP